MTERAIIYSRVLTEEQASSSRWSSICSISREVNDKQRCWVIKRAAGTLGVYEASMNVSLPIPSFEDFRKMLQPAFQ